MITALVFAFSYTLNAQEDQTIEKEKIDKKSYYEQRAKEDARFEQQFKAETEAEEEAFWEEQKDYEKNLRKRDRKAYIAYMRGKRDAYAEHYEHCDRHCHHNDYYYYHAAHYHYGYRTYYYQRYPRRSTTINTGIRLSAPRVKIGF